MGSRLEAEVGFALFVQTFMIHEMLPELTPVLII